MSEQIEKAGFNIDASTLREGNVLFVVGQEPDQNPVVYAVYVTRGAVEGDSAYGQVRRHGAALSADRDAAKELAEQRDWAILGTCQSVDESNPDTTHDQLNPAITSGSRLCFGSIDGASLLITEPLIDAAAFDRDYS